MNAYEKIKNRVISNQWIGLMLLLLASFIVRMLALGKSALWQDEMIFVSIISNPEMTPWQTFLNYWGVVVSMAQLPFAGVFQNIWMRMLQGWVPGILHSPFWLRFPHVVMGTAAVFMFYKAARLLLVKTEAWAASLMVAVFFYPVFYSREAYCYAPVLLFSASSTYFFYLLLIRDRFRIRDVVLLLFSMLGLVFSHFAGTMYVVSLALIAALVWTASIVKKPFPWLNSRAAFFSGCACGLTLLLIAPYYVRIFTADNPHLKEKSSANLLLVLNDGVSKMFLGDHVWLAGVAWLLLLVGAVSFLLHVRRKPYGLFLVLSFVVTSGLLLWGTHNTQYTSARYFSPVYPVVYLLFAHGIWALCSMLNPKAGRAVAWSVMGVLLGIQGFLFLPKMYALPHKSVDFKSIAEWLNTHLEPGTPYVMESAYELRFVSGYYPTPNLVAARPYVHGPGNDEMQRLHTYQREFIEEFPEAPFIESVHHRADTPEGVWEWPASFYAQRAELRNDPVRSLIRLGIYPTFFHYKLTDYSFITYIYYNTPQDIERWMESNGRSVYVKYPGWQCVPLYQGAHGEVYYGRFSPGRSGRMQVANLSKQSLNGRLQLELVVMGKGDEACACMMRVGDNPPVAKRQKPGAMFQFEIPSIELPVVGTPLLWQIQQCPNSQIDGAVIRSATWLEDQR